MGGTSHVIPARGDYEIIWWEKDVDYANRELDTVPIIGDVILVKPSR